MCPFLLAGIPVKNFFRRFLLPLVIPSWVFYCRAVPYCKQRKQ